MSGERRGTQPSQPAPAPQPGSQSPSPFPSGVRHVLRDVLSRLWHNGYLKLAALLLAVILWIFVSTDEALVSQRTLRAPLNIEGLGPNQRAPGLPERVEVRLSGPASRIASLNPEGLDVVLNLRGVSGSFEQNVRVFPPQGITLVGVTPSELSGTVEVRASKRVSVRSVLAAERPEDAVIEIEASPAEVTVSGASSLVEQVTQVLVPFDPAQGRDRAAPYAVDGAGEPVAGVTVAPAQVGLRAVRQEVLYTRQVPLELASFALPELEVESAQLTPPEVRLVGPQAALGALTRVQAALSETPPTRPGQYTLALRLELPEGVFALDTPRLTLLLRGQLREPSGAATP